MAAQTRERIVQHSAELFRRQGFAGTGVKQIVAEASAPFGSLYHFFPGGKEQLGEEVIRSSGAIYGQLLDAFYAPGEDPVAATRNFFAAAAQTLSDSGYADACPIATVA
ncbi:MAG TPA: TetR/AcrR family transcriptional regulator, partial [Solirubrobacteraceae bacterium]|nr:TetR/AcrR family transcriptional regulator [Solirubrobacteraceae bacterium]